MPPLVQDYALRAAPGSGAVPGTITLRQVAEMPAGPGGRWQALTAEQVIGMRRPGFVGLAQARLGPLPDSVLDAYAGGGGLLEARLFGVLRVPVVTGPQAGKRELMRYLAELLRAPHAMLHNPHLRWRMMDATPAKMPSGLQWRTGSGPPSVPRWKRDPGRGGWPPVHRRPQLRAGCLSRGVPGPPRDRRLPHPGPDGGGLDAGRRPRRLRARNGDGPPGGLQRLLSRATRERE